LTLGNPFLRGNQFCPESSNVQIPTEVPANRRFGLTESSRITLTGCPEGKSPEISS
jgi:hypothetical protein